MPTPHPTAFLIAAAMSEAEGVMASSKGGLKGTGTGARAKGMGHADRRTPWNLRASAPMPPGA